ncbi:MAG: inositol monophosphatase family protein [Pseudomonadota bacterium]
MAHASPLITVMVGAARKAARSLRRDFGEVEQLQVSRKGAADFVSAADVRAEEILVEELRKARPKYGFLLEEGGEIEGTDNSNRWIVDPLDGTTNFLHGLPHFAISIALERDREPYAGVIFNPITDELYWGEKGQGAFMNERRLRVSGRSDLSESIFATGIPFLGRGEHDQFLGELRRIMAHTAGVRRWGAAALDLAFVAAGRYDGFWERGLAPWDVAAGMVLVREAGGVVETIEGGRKAHLDGSIAASNGAVHTAFAGLVKDRD